MSTTMSPPPAATSAAAYLLLLAEEMLSQLPDCARTAATEGVSASSCGLDVACLCMDDTFLSHLEGVLATSCSAADEQKSLALADQLCTTADPILLESHGPTIVALIAILLTLVLFSVTGRLVARRLSRTQLWWDDWLIMVSLPVTIILDVTCFIAVHAGWGRHILTLDESQVTTFLKVLFANPVIGMCGNCITKSSILLLYHRIFPSKRFKVACIVVGVFLIISWLASLLVFIFSCHPVQYFWDKSIPGGVCWSYSPLFLGLTGASLVTDLMVWLLPLPFLWNLQVKLPKKLAVAGIFLLGGFVCIASAVRLPLLLYVDENDVTWTTIYAGIWTSIECNLGVVCACLPIIRPLFRRLPPLSSFRCRSCIYITPTANSYSDVSLGAIPAGHNLSSDATSPSDKGRGRGAKPSWYSVVMPSVAGLDDNAQDKLPMVDHVERIQGTKSDV